MPNRFGGELPLLRVADGDQDVADEALPPGALDRRAGKTGAERGVVETGKLGQKRGGKILALRETRLASDLRELVPWTNRQTVVATENAVADAGPQLRCDVPLVLD